MGFIRYILKHKLIIIGTTTPFLALISASCTTTKDLDIEFRKVENFNFDVVDKKNISVINLEISQLSIPQINSEIYDLSIKIINRDIENSSVEIIITLSEKSMPENFRLKRLTIKEFKMLEDSDVNFAALNVTIDYPNKNQIFANDADLTLLQVSNFSTDFYDFIRIDVTKNLNSLLVKYKLRLKNNKTESQEFSKEITGFRRLFSKDELDVEVQKIDVTISNMAPVGDFQNKDFVVNGLNSDLFEIEIESSKIFNDLLISWKIKQKDIGKIFSIKKTKIIFNFSSGSVTQEDVNNQVKKVSVEYSEKDFISINDADKFGLIFRNLEVGFLPVIDKFEKIIAEKSAVVTYRIVAADNEKLTSQPITITIRGFGQSIM